MAILELRAARGWSLEQTARALLVTAATVSSWMKRLDEQGPDTLLQLSQPVNKFPEFVGYLVRRLQTLCPTLGRRKIAEVLARAGLHLGASTVRRMLNDASPVGAPTTPPPAPPPTRIVTAREPNHVWHVDLTVVPTKAGFWVPWLPLSLPQRWPFCWWIVVVVDHYSRRVMGAGTFRKQPTSEAVRAFLGRAMQQAGAHPEHLICDKGGQFWCDGFKRWCRRRGIRLRFGAIGKQRSIAVVERFIQTLKQLLAQLPFMPLRAEEMRRELMLLALWYNEHRPHTTLGGCTPNEVYFKQKPIHRMPRFEPRSRWPRDSPCAKPRVLVRGQPGVRLQLEVGFLAGYKHLPIVRLARVA
jgi:putative transposase